MKSLVEDLILNSKRRGWASGMLKAPNHSDYIMSNLATLASHCNLQPVSNRSGEGFVTNLIPTTRENANPLSLSAISGLDKQPLHTDGSHLRLPPDYIILWSKTKNNTPTRIWKPENIPTRYVNGVFVVYDGKERRLTHAYNSGEIQFDPCCMSPLDAASRALSEYFLDPPEKEIESIHWDAPGKIVLIRNKQVLHGRAKVAEADLGRQLQRIAFRRKKL